MENVKLTEQELQQIQDLRLKYANVTAQLGQLKVEQILVNKQLTRLNDLENQFIKDYEQVQTDEEQFAKLITEKYGIGDVDVESGIFTPESPSV
jgi:predicted nuclease with TOPRIM domain